MTPLGADEKARDLCRLVIILRQIAGHTVGSVSTSGSTPFRLPDVDDSKPRQKPTTLETQRRDARILKTFVCISPTEPYTILDWTSIRLAKWSNCLAGDKASTPSSWCTTLGQEPQAGQWSRTNIQGAHCLVAAVCQPCLSYLLRSCMANQTL